MPLPGLSVAPEAVTVTDAAVDQASEPPVTVVGSVGTVRSILTVLAAPAVGGAHGEALPARSVPRSCTSVAPSFAIVAVEPACGALQVVPPSVDVRYWYVSNPAPPLSVEPLAEMATPETFCQVSEPPLTVGVVGTVRSSLTVLLASGTDGAQPDVNPAASMALICTTVVPV